MLYFSPVKIFLVIVVCVLSIAFSAPNFSSQDSSDSFPYNILPKEKVNLGLDLRGGSHLLLQIDFNYYLQEHIVNLRNDLKKSFLEEKVYSLPILQGSSIVFSLDKNDKEIIKKAKKIIKKLDEEIDINLNKGKFKLSYSDTKKVAMKRDLIQQSIAIVRRRVDETGTKEPTIQAQGGDRILLQMPGVENPEKIKELLGKTAKLTFHFVLERNFADNSNEEFDYNVVRMQDVSGREYLIKKPVILSGDMLTGANATFYENEPAVGFQFNTAGTRKFTEITTNNVGRVFAIVLDGEVVTAPRINSIINQGAGVISGNFTTQQAKQVALLLRAGALPAPLSIIEERTVGPSLGSDSVNSGTSAAIYGFILVAVLMVVFYSYFGLIANFALVINIALILTVLSLMGATLTLPGIAGIVLTIGMAVDANVLIFERIKEEVRDNKKIISAMADGFSQAFRTIIDANITTLIIAVFLYMFGSGPIRGFAVTLSIGILSSMFSAIILTRMIIVLWVRYKKSTPQKLPI
jgi:protein-export membrane protein SecD